MTSKIIVNLNYIDDLKKFVNVANRYVGNIRALSAGYVVDAKSIMGMLSLDLSRPITIEIQSVEVDEIMDAFGEFTCDAANE